MSESSLRDLKRIESKLRDVYLITSKILSKTKDLTEVKSGEARERLAEEIGEDVTLLDMLKREITEALLVYAIRYQPLGRDFRRVHAFLDALYDVYRISRYCREITLVDRYVRRLSDESLGDVRGLLELASRAYENAYNALFEDCKSCFEQVQEIDNVVDNLYLSYLKEIGGKETLPNPAVARILILRHVERIVDHAVRIASYHG
ncbi:MAG: PhoU domain-containing protein [Zestosphaera sp.]